MVKVYKYVSYKNLSKLFTNAIPCFCHEERPYNKITYYLRTTRTNKIIENRGAVIKTVHVRCNYCGAEMLKDIERLGICQGDIKIH